VLDGLVVERAGAGAGDVLGGRVGGVEPVGGQPGADAGAERLGQVGISLGAVALQPFDRGIDLHQRQAGVVEKDLARSGQLHAAGTAAQQFDPDLVFQIPNLPAQRRLRSVQPSFGRDGETALLGNRNEVAKMPQFDAGIHI